MSSKRPHILLSNDDGYLAPGILSAYQALSTFANVSVVAPERNHSGASSALTLHLPLSVYTAHWGPQQGFQYVNGTPADCVHIALTGLLPIQPDLVVSGINHGQNMGEDVLYSGTVAAALEGFLCGVPALAVSQVEKGWQHLDNHASWLAHFAKKIITNPIHSQSFLLNINLPNRALSSMESPIFTRLGSRHRSQPVIQQFNPQQEPIYWIGPQGSANDCGLGTDFHHTQHQEISITPLQVDMTNHKEITSWQNWLESAPHE